MNEPAVNAPELEPNLGWLNTDHPLRIKNELKGQVILLDFWTYCCINCIHILPDLEYLEDKYKDEPFQVIGVHSAKFDNEADRETIRAAVQRYKIHHPVVIDQDMALWNKYTARGWPTFVLINSKGHVVGMTSGEGHRDVLDKTIAKLLAEGKADGTLAKAPLKINREGFIAATGELAFPGKVLADAESKRLFIADSNHNRIIVSALADEAGHAKLITVIGSGKEGKADGKLADATFHNPQGMALKGNLLYIADTDNHLIREANLDSGTVRTIAGTGKQGYDRVGGKAGTAQEISSPWDLQLDGEKLFIAMAGNHQIWVMDLKTQEVKAFSGNGGENIVDGLARDACFAQPSGITWLDGNLYIADSEVSGIRKVDPNTGTATTMVGEGLFVFGDVDGAGDAVRLQHALGVEAWKNSILVADTYNHKIKKLDPATRSVTSLYGTGKPATKTADGKPAFFEPGGLSVAGDQLYVADTNNHRIVDINLDSGDWSEVMISGLSAPKSNAKAEKGKSVAAVFLSDSAATITLSLNARLPSDAHPSAEAPMHIKVSNGETPIVSQTLKTEKLPVELNLRGSDIPSSGTLNVTWSFAWCTEGNSAVCVPRRETWDVPVSKAAGGGKEKIELKAE